MTAQLTLAADLGDAGKYDLALPFDEPTDEATLPRQIGWRKFETPCTNLVERRSGGGIKTGAGPRSGKHSALCGKPAPAGSMYCRPCTTTLKRQTARAHEDHHNRIARQLRTAGEPNTLEDVVAACGPCSRSSR